MRRPFLGGGDLRGRAGRDIRVSGNETFAAWHPGISPGERCKPSAGTTRARFEGELASPRIAAGGTGGIPCELHAAVVCSAALRARWRRRGGRGGAIARVRW